jgi:hypothetical protein
MAMTPDLCLFDLDDLLAPLKQAGTSAVAATSLENVEARARAIVLATDNMQRSEVRALVDAFSRRGICLLIVQSTLDEVWDAELLLRGAGDCFVRQEPTRLARQILHAAHRQLTCNRDDRGLQRLMDLSAFEQKMHSLRIWLPELDVAVGSTSAESQRPSSAALSFMRAIMSHLVRELGWRASSSWLRHQPIFEGRTCLQLLSEQQNTETALRAVFGGTVQDFLDPITDKNLVAFQAEKEDLARRYPGGVVAYYGGKRLAIAQDTTQLEREIPAHLREEQVMVQDLSEPVLRMRRPRRIISER